MDIKTKMQDALNAQINMELSSAYIYLAMAAYFEKENLKGFGHWMMKQAKEEETHAMKIFKHVHERNGQIDLKAIPQPKLAFTSAEEAFTDSLLHERKVTQSIYDLVDLANKEKEIATATFLQWFVNEQVEEEANATEMVQKLKMAGKTPAMLLMLDSFAGKRE